MDDTVSNETVLGHSALGASGMLRWANCPGSFSLSRKEPRHRAPTVYAAAGTVAHSLVEQAVHAMATGGDPLGTLRDSEGITVEVDGHAVLVDDTMTDGVRVMLEYIARRQRELGVPPLVEQTVFLDDYFRSGEPPPVRLFGRCDVQFRTADLVEVIDYKNGAGVLVAVTDHPQLMYYAAGVLARLAAQDIWPARVRLTVVQPNARSVDKIRSQDLTALDVLVWVDEVLVPAVRRCQDATAPLVTGDWCRFCPVTHACPALFQAAQDAAQTDFADTDEPDRIAGRLDLAEKVILWAEAMRGFGLDRIRAGVKVPGWGEVPTRPTRRWTDIPTVEELLQGYDVHETKLRSPAQVQKILKAKPKVWDTVKPLVEAKSSGTKLARVSRDGTELFDDVESA